MPEHLRKEFNVINLINGYRTRGHLFTDTNPVRERRKYTPTLDLVNFGLGEEDLDQEFQAGSLIGIGKARLRDIVQHLHQTYCASIGAEYKYIRNPEIVEWLEQRMEGRKNTPPSASSGSGESWKNSTRQLPLRISFIPSSSDKSVFTRRM